METIYIGVDFHARQQTICYLITETGELVTSELKHQDKAAVRAFYEQFAGRPVIIAEFALSHAGLLCHTHLEPPFQWSRLEPYLQIVSLSTRK